MAALDCQGVPSCQYFLFPSKECSRRLRTLDQACLRWQTVVEDTKGALHEALRADPAGYPATPTLSSLQYTVGVQHGFQIETSHSHNLGVTSRYKNSTQPKEHICISSFSCSLPPDIPPRKVTFCAAYLVHI